MQFKDLRFINSPRSSLFKRLFHGAESIWDPGDRNCLPMAPLGNVQAPVGMELLSRAFSTLSPFTGQVKAAESWRGSFPRDPSMICPLCRHFDKKMKWIPKHCSSSAIDSPTGSFSNKWDQCNYCVCTQMSNHNHYDQISWVFPRKNSIYPYLGEERRFTCPSRTQKRFRHFVSWTKSWKQFTLGNKCIVFLVLCSIQPLPPLQIQLWERPKIPQTL